MIGRTNAGGTGRLFSIIAVSYPEGSVCICTNGTSTLKARDTSGKALFNVPVGSWTVSCTDGSSTASQTVSITAEGQDERVTLSYNFVLFASGSGLAAGYTAESKTTAAYSFTDSALVFNNNKAQGLKGLITPAIDLTDFSKMLVTYKDVAYYDEGTTGKGFVGVTDKEYSDWGSYNSPGFSKYIRPSSGGDTQELDISDLSGNHYFALSGDWFAITVTSIIFE